jgi:hypothetical protein
MVHRRQFPAAMDPFYPYIMHGLEEQLSDEGYSVMLLTLNDDQISAGPSALPALQEQRADALVLAGPDISPGFILAIINLGLLTALGVRNESCRVGVWLALGVELMTHIPVSYAFTYQSNLRPPYTISPTSKTMVNSIIGGIIMFLMISAPIWLYTLWKLRHRWMT